MYGAPSCLQEQPIYKNSQSTLGGKWGPPGGVEVDELGRPVVWNDGRETLRRAEMDGEKEERIRRVETYLKSSNLSLVCNSSRQITLFFKGNVVLCFIYCHWTLHGDRSKGENAFSLTTVKCSSSHLSCHLSVTV